MRHRHLTYPPDTPVESIPSAALVDLFERVGFFADGDGDGAEADGAASIVLCHDAHHLLVHFVEAAAVDFE